LPHKGSWLLLCGSIIYGNWLAPMTSIPGNLVQMGVATGIVLPILPKLKNSLKRKS
jgi:hypothetical protein